MLPSTMYLAAAGQIPQSLKGTPMDSQDFLNVIEQQKLIGLHEIEELESKVAPDGGETVLPLSKTHRH